MIRSERLEAVLDLLAEAGQVDIDDIVSTLGVSPATARRDLDSLAKQRLLTRTHGGATTGTVSYDLPGRYNRDDNAEAKQRIAEAASELITPGAVIGLSGGTTTTALAQVLSTRADLNAKSDHALLTVVTNAINIAAQLAVRPNIKVIVIGGVLNPRSYELVGPYTDLVMNRIALDLAFIGVNGIDHTVGPTVSDESEASVNLLMAQRAAASYVLADSSKVGRRALATLGDYEFTRLITDSGLTAEDKAAFEERGVDVTVVPAKA